MIGQPVLSGHPLTLTVSLGDESEADLIKVLENVFEYFIGLGFDEDALARASHWLACRYSKAST